MLPDCKKMIGWDIGGANVKAAILHGNEIYNVHQIECPLWKGVHKLRECMNAIITTTDSKYGKHVFTMTGELVDHFDDRKQGVMAIIHEIENRLSQEETLYFAGELGLINAQQALSEHQKVASANWLASAYYTRKKIDNALFIDVGSTTTDIVCINNRKLVYSGYNDEQRLIAKELVYCGVVRTPIFALCRQALVRGQQIPIMSEYFANMADVYRITGELQDYADLGDTLDGRGKDQFSSIKRLARMFANDASHDEIEIWQQTALQIRTMQLQMIKDACRHQLMKNKVPLSTPVVGAGVGRFLAKDIAQELGKEYIDYNCLFNVDDKIVGFGVADCAPAASLVCLAAEE